MARLPQPGSDNGQWGDILNEYLSVSHADDGTLKPGTVEGAQLVDGVVTSSKLSAGSATNGQVLSYSSGNLTWTTPVSVTAPVTSVASKTGAVTLVKSDVGLDNVDNTSDANKPVSGATLTALNAKVNTSTVGAASGVASLGSDSKIPESQLPVRLATLVYSVRTYGATGNGSTDDTDAIKAAIAAAPVGAIVYFPVGTYKISDIIVPKVSQTLEGASRELSIIRAADNSNLDAGIASPTWVGTTSTSSDNPINVKNLTISMNKANQTSGIGHGIALNTFWNYLENLTIYNTRGDGVHISSTRRDGVELSGSAGVENHISRVDVRGADGYGIRVYDVTPASQSVTDGWIVDCAIQTTLQDGIRIDSGAGWEVKGTHLYGTQKHGIHIGRADSVRVVDNYIESWGFSATPASYAAIAIGDSANTSTATGNPIIVANNTAFFLGSSYGTAATGTFIRGILVAVAGGGTANLSVTGNAIKSHVQFAGGNTTVGFRPTGPSGAILNLAESGNIFTGFGYYWDVSSTLSVNMYTSRSPLAINSQSATAYTINSLDRGKVIETTSDTAVTITVPTSTNQPLPIGTTVEVVQIGLGQVTFAPMSGVTLRSSDAQLKTRVQFSSVTLRKQTIDTWIITGDKAA